MAGPRFLSVGLIIIFLFCFSCVGTLCCIGDRLVNLIFLFLVDRCSCFRFRSFSKVVIFSSISNGTGISPEIFMLNLK